MHALECSVWLKNSPCCFERALCWLEMSLSGPNQQSVGPERAIFRSKRSLLFSKRAARRPERVLCYLRGLYFSMREPFVDMKGPVST